MVEIVCLDPLLIGGHLYTHRNGHTKITLLFKPREVLSAPYYGHVPYKEGFLEILHCHSLIMPFTRIPLLSTESWFDFLGIFCGWHLVSKISIWDSCIQMLAGQCAGEVTSLCHGRIKLGTLCSGFRVRLLGVSHLILHRQVRSHWII